MSRWFRHYAGMMRDEKLVRAALQAKQPIERVLWVWGAILESASEINDGGRYEVDNAEMAYFLRADQGDVDAITNALGILGRTRDGFVAAWGDRQFQSDRSADRQQRHRDRKKGHGDGHPPESDGRVTAESRHGDAPETETETEKKEDCRVADATPTPSSKVVRLKYSDEFEAFWRPYPKTPVMSKAETLKAWEKLSEEDRHAATAAVAKFCEFLKSKPDHPAVHACRFLSQRRFDGFSQGPPEQTNEEREYLEKLARMRAAAEQGERVSWDEQDRRNSGVGQNGASRSQEL